MKLTPLKRFIAGVDPGEKTGIGVYDRKQDRIVMITTTDFWGVKPWFMRMLRVSELKVYVEVNAPYMYDRNDEIEDKKRDRYMLNVGGVRREGQLLARGLRNAGFDVEEIRPVPQAKWDQATFQRLCRSTRTANAHERDACRIALIYATKRKELS